MQVHLFVFEKTKFPSIIAATALIVLMSSMSLNKGIKMIPGFTYV